MTSRTLHNAATTSWITYYSTFPAGSRGGALVGGPPVKSSYKQLLRIFGSNSHTIYEIETLIIKRKTTKHNSNLQIVRQYELLSSSVWKKWVKQLGTPNVHVSRDLNTDVLDLHSEVNGKMQMLQRVNCIVILGS